MVWSEAGSTWCETTRGRPACEEELGLDVITLSAPAVTVVTTTFQMKKIRLREICSRIQQQLRSTYYLSGAVLSAGESAMSRECSESHSVMSNSLQPHGLHSPWNSPGQNAGVGSLSLLQGIFPNQGSNPGLPHCRRILYQLSHRGSPLEGKD